MKKINIAKVPVEKWGSPKGKFAQRCRGISIALGARGKPFDLELTAIPPGRSMICPGRAALLINACQMLPDGSARTSSTSALPPPGRLRPCRRA